MILPCSSFSSCPCSSLIRPLPLSEGQEYSRKKNKNSGISELESLMVASQGFEPQQAESESAVLPLHHEAIA